MQGSDKYKLAKKIKREYNSLKEEEINVILQKSPEEKLRLFEELQEFISEFYKAGMKYAKRNLNKNK
ncbi:MAG: hypothetical protein AB1393_00145 [Candidatus Edwardsbacteria bacterium]